MQEEQEELSRSQHKLRICIKLRDAELREIQQRQLTALHKLNECRNDEQKAALELRRIAGACQLAKGQEFSPMIFA